MIPASSPRPRVTPIIAHDGPKTPRHSIKDAGSYVRRVLMALGVPPLGILRTPDLGIYRPEEPIPPRIRPAPFEAATLTRGGRRVDPATERRRRLRAS